MTTVGQNAPAQTTRRDIIDAAQIAQHLRGGHAFLAFAARVRRDRTRGSTASPRRRKARVGSVATRGSGAAFAFAAASANSNASGISSLALTERFC